MRRRAVLAALIVAGAVACGRGAPSGSARQTPAPRPVACTGSGVQTIASGVLTVGSDIAYAPFESVDPATQKPVGFDVDLLTEIAKRNGLRAEFVNQTFSGVIAGLLARRYDVVASAMLITPDRRAQLCFSDPYVDANQSLVVNRQRSPDIRSTDDLGGKTVGVQADTTGEQWADEHLKGKVRTIKSYETAHDAFLDLKAGTIDAIVNELPVSLYRQKLEPDTLEVVEEIPTDEHYGIAVHSENKSLLDAVNRALGQIRADGTYDRIYRTWFGQDPGEMRR